jgi:hypothetical protein
VSYLIVLVRDSVETRRRACITFLTLNKPSPRGGSGRLRKNRQKNDSPSDLYSSCQNWSPESLTYPSRASRWIALAQSHGGPPAARQALRRREPARTGRWRLPHQPDTRTEPAADDILSSASRPMPVLLLARRRPRPPIRTQARPPVPRGLLARGWRTVTSWIRAAKLSDPFRPCYSAVAAPASVPTASPGAS